MTYPVFTNGTVLPASDLNAIGLWLVKSQAIGSGVSSVTVTGAFTSDYDNYRVIISGCTYSSTDVTLSLKFENGGLSTYYSSGNYVLFTGLGGGSPANNGTTAGIGIGITGTDSGSTNVADVFQPNIAAYTRAIGQSVGVNYVANYQGVMKTATAYTTLIIVPAAGTMTGGTIRIYGYRN